MKGRKTIVATKISQKIDDNNRNASGYVYIDDIEQHLNNYAKTSIYRVLHNHYLKLIERFSNHNDVYFVKIFIASKDDIDRKIDDINRRINKRYKS